MNAERLLEHFHRISDAPDAIPRLRRLVLDLAVRGKLVPQDPADEPASELLRRIAAGKAQSVKRRNNRSSRTVVTTRGITAPFSVASTWIWASFGDIVISRDGERIPVSKEKRSTRAKTYDYYGASGVIDRIDGYLFDTPLLLIGEDGANLINRSTPIAFIAHGKYWVNNHAHVIDGLSLEFLRYLEMFINAISLRPYVTGTAQPKMNQAKMNSIPVALPPLAEQRRIVAKVDELMALCDRLEAARAGREATRDRLAAASLARLNAPEADPSSFAHHARFALDNLAALTARPDQVKQLRQTILNLAVRGGLVPQDPNDEPAPQLLQRNGVGQQKNDRTYQSLPTTWGVVRLGDLLAEDSLNGYSRRPDDAVDGTPILRINAGTARRDGIVAEEEHKLVSGITDNLKGRFSLKRGDLLACRFNGNKTFVGRLALFRDYLQIAPIFPDKLIRLRISRDLASPEFVRLAGDGDFVRASVEASCTTTVGNWGISASSLRDVSWPLPPLAEQRRIVAKVDELMALCDQLEASLAAGDDTRRRLLDALLAEAITPNASAVSA